MTVEKKVVVKDDRTVFEKQEDAWFENDCQGDREDYIGDE